MFIYHSELSKPRIGMLKNKNKKNIKHLATHLKVQKYFCVFIADN